MSASVQGAAEVRKNLEALKHKYGQTTADAAVAGGNLVRSTAIRSIQATSSGHEVTRYRNGGGAYAHTASAEGSAPNTDTGRLVSSIFVEIKRDEVFVGSTLEYAGHLEFGTKNMGARPWLDPALEQNRRTIENLFRRGVQRVSRDNEDL